MGASFDARFLRAALAPPNAVAQGEYSQRTAPRYEAAGKPVVRVAVPLNWATDAKGSNYHLNRIRRVAKNYKDLKFAGISSSFYDLAEFGASGDFSVTVSDVATGKKYAFEGTWNPGKDDPAAVTAFLDSFLKARRDGSSIAVHPQLSPSLPRVTPPSSCCSLAVLAHAPGLDRTPHSQMITSPLPACRARLSRTSSLSPSPRARRTASPLPWARTSTRSSSTTPRTCSSSSTRRGASA